jgi:hypothetical protein
VCILQKTERILKKVRLDLLHLLEKFNIYFQNKIKKFDFCFFGGTKFPPKKKVTKNLGLIYVRRARAVHFCMQNLGTDLHHTVSMVGVTDPGISGAWLG